MEKLHISIKFSYHRSISSYEWNGCRIFETFAAWKVSVFGVILVPIFPHSDCIRRDLSVSSPNTGKYGPE